MPGTRPGMTSVLTAKEPESWIVSSLSLPCANASRLSQAMTRHLGQDPAFSRRESARGMSNPYRL
jgi:hypothetical protein